MINVLIADDHQAVRKRLMQLLKEAFSTAEIVEADDAISLVVKAIDGKWDIIVSDLAMPGGNGLDAVKKIRKQLPDQRILIVSINDEERYAGYARTAGAWGYVNKTKVTEEFLPAVKTILDGNTYFPSLEPVE